MELTIPTWVLPLLGSVAAFAIAFGAVPESRGDYDFSPVLGCIYVPLAGCAALAMWLAWALLA